MPTPAEEHAFLQLIADRFRDDGPRLMFADYLSASPEPADHARGEFIRLQLALARISDDHPHRAALSERREGLLARHHDEWTRHLKGLAAGFQFRRGVIDAVTVDVDQFADRGDELFRRAPIRQVRVTDAGRHIDRLAGLPLLGRVRELVLCDGGLGNGGLGVLLRSPFLGHVESLDLSFNGLCDAGVGALANSPALPRLRHLFLNDNRFVTGDGARHLATSKHLSELRVLDLSANAICDAGLTALAAPAALPHLHTLRVRANRVGDAGCKALGRSALLGRLLAHDPRLDLRQNDVGPAGLAALVASPQFAAARCLDLANNELDDDAVAALVGSEHAGRLTKVLVQRNRLGDRAAVTLARSALMPQLTAIDVSFNKLTRRGIDELWKRRRDWRTVIQCEGNVPGVSGPSPRLLARSGAASGPSQTAPPS